MILTYADLLHTYGTHANMSVLIRRSYPIKRISRSSRPRRSSARPSHHECGIVSCVSRGARNGRAKDHPHPSRTSHKRPAERSLPSRRPQPPHGESRKSPLRCANVTNDGALGHSMEHVDDVRHARAVEPQPRAAIHLQPPSVAGGLQTCAETVRSMRHGQRRRGGGRRLAAIVF